ncbi:hypothetical protein [Pseudomonas juntendi]
MASSVASGAVLKRSDSRRLSQRHKPLRSQKFHAIARLVEEHEKHRIEYRHFDVQFDQGGEVIDGFSEVDRLGVEIDFFDLASGRIMVGELQKEIGSTASEIR